VCKAIEVRCKGVEGRALLSPSLHVHVQRELKNLIRAQAPAQRLRYVASCACFVFLKEADDGGVLEADVGGA
jgi:hypothetical protein